MTSLQFSENSAFIAVGVVAFFAAIGLIFAYVGYGILLLIHWGYIKLKWVFRKLYYNLSYKIMSFYESNKFTLSFKSKI